jgi:hypothetical protein
MSSIASGIPKEQPDTIFLSSAMRLVTSAWSSNDTMAKSSDLRYITSRQLYSHLEARGVLSLRVFQGLLLIAMYELGNAIFPAAYMTVGSCARLGQALGIHKRKGVTRMLGSTCKLQTTVCLQVY